MGIDPRECMVPIFSRFDAYWILSCTVLYYRSRLCSVKFISLFIPRLYHTAANPSDMFMSTKVL